MNSGQTSVTAKVATALMALAMLAGCNTISSPVATGPVASGPVANGDVPIASALEAPPGSNEDFIINVGRRVYFTESSAALDATAKATLDKQAVWLQTYPTYKVKIEGFADDPGSPEANKALGLRRAQAMMAYLGTKGIPPGRMRAKSFGTERVVKKCDDISCYSQNRRGVTVLDTEVDS